MLLVSCNFFNGFPRLYILLNNIYIVAAVLVGHAIAGLLGTPLVVALGRDSLCYLLAIITLLWTMAWWLFVRDSPAEHPRLSAEQRHHLQRAIGPGVSARNAVSCVNQTGRCIKIIGYLRAICDPPPFSVWPVDSIVALL